MRNLLCWVLVLMASAPIQAQPQAVVFDGKTTSGWVIEGDSEVKDGVLILGGIQKTWARIAIDLSRDFELELEYSTEHNRPHIQFECHHRHFFLGQGTHSVSLERTSKKPGEWIEAVFWGQEDAAGNGWVNNSKWRVVGDPAFANQPMGGSSDLPRSVFVAFEIPAGQKLYLRNVRVKTAPVTGAPWFLVFTAGAVLGVVIIVLAAMTIMKKPRTTTKDVDHGPAPPS